MSKIQEMTRDARQAIFIGMGLTASLLLTVFLFRTGWLQLFQSQTFSPGTKGRSQVQSLISDEAYSADAIRFLLDRVKHDPDDFLAQSMLASSLLQKVRETGNADYLQRAMGAAQASLTSVPAERNTGGLSALARAEMAEHNFVKARELAARLTQIDPGTIASWGVLTDALLELGDYAKADGAIQKMRQIGSDTAETEIRMGRLLFLQGDTAGAQKHLFRALAFALNVPRPTRETVAWCRWQLGEMAFSIGQYQPAERYYRESLAAYPGYVQALASLGRVRAAQRDLAGAIQQYENAIRRFPDPTFIAALGDLYHLAGQEKQAQTQYDLVEQIGHLNALNGSRYNRQIALFYADHGRKTGEAYNDAVREYADRRDIYGADTLAWAALKAGKLAEAQQAMSAALRLSTRDAKLYYHAGMIARATGDHQLSRDFLRRALRLNPSFDPLQATVARKALEN